MPLPDAFWEQLPQKSDEELYEVLLREEDYLPEAVAAVQEELRKRKLSPKKAAEMAAAAVQSQMQVAQIEADERQKRRFAKWAFHIFLWLAIPLAALIKLLLSLLMGS